MTRTRFAPSPTGYLHIGGVRTALYNWLYAKQNGGQFILRIDDTDEQRNVEEALAPILHGLRWMGIDWDEGPEVGGLHGPYFQSQKLARYQEAVDTLLANGVAYRDYATKEELAAEKAEAEKAKRKNIYSRKWMAETDADCARFESEGRGRTVRLKMPREGTCEFDDHIRGRVCVEWANEQDHFIQRDNGTFLYHLANVVDDYDMKITHVIRAEEHLSNTPRQIFIAQGLGYPVPEYAHLPFVAEPGSKNKLSKRKIAKYLKNQDFRKVYERGRLIAERMGLEIGEETFNPVITDFFEQVGYLPDAVVNYLLLLGWAYNGKKEDFTRTEMLELFTLEKVNKAPASLDVTKLESFQARYMQHLLLDEKLERVLPFLQRVQWIDTPPSPEQRTYVSRLLEAIGVRLEVAGDILTYGDFFIEDADQLPLDEKALNKEVLSSDEGKALLENLREQLVASETFDAGSLSASVRAYLDAEGIKMRKMDKVLRVTLTGKTAGVSIFDTLELLGKVRSLARIDRVLGM